jgi:hypothetical protein
MPLAPSTLQSQLESLFAEPPESFAEVAQGWADAVNAYASGVTPASSGVSGAAATLAGALAAAFATPGGAPPLMEVAFLAFGATVGVGMTPLVAVPPAGPVGFVAHFAGPKPATHAEAAEQLATLIHDWMTTGVANTVPPTSPIPWA